MEKGEPENPNRLNKYACACSIVASMITIIFGYGKIFNFLFLIFIYINFVMFDFFLKNFLG